METTQIFGTNQPQIVENAVDRSLETLSLRAEKDKDSKGRGILWNIDKVKIVTCFSEREGWVDLGGGGNLITGYGNYQITIYSENRDEGYQEEIEKVYAQLKENLPEPVNHIFSRINPNGGWYQI